LNESRIIDEISKEMYLFRDLGLDCKVMGANEIHWSDDDDNYLVIMIQKSPIDTFEEPTLSFTITKELVDNIDQIIDWAHENYTIVFDCVFYGGEQDEMGLTEAFYTSTEMIPIGNKCKKIKIIFKYTEYLKLSTRATRREHNFLESNEYPKWVICVDDSWFNQRNEY
jgi:hypothetical protein